MRSLILASMLALVAVRGVDGCTWSYHHTPIHELVALSQAIFIGEPLESAGEERDPRRTVSYRVIRTLKSAGPLPDVYTLLEPRRKCRAYEESAQWLMFVSLDSETGEPRAAEIGCDNKPVDKARPNIEFLEAWASGKDSTQIVIDIQDPGIDVGIRSAGREYQSSSGSDGLAVFTGIPAGAYRVSAIGAGYVPGNLDGSSKPKIG